MKVRKCIATLGAALMLCMIASGAVPMVAKGEAGSARFELKTLSMTKSEEKLAAEAGDDSFYYIGNDKKEESLNQWVAFEFQLEEAGEYQVKLVTKKHEKKGIFQMSINGQNTGKPFDQFGSGGEITVDMGTVQIAAPGKQEVKFQILEKNEKSPTYQIAIRAIILTKTEEAVIPDVEFGENVTSKSGNVIAYPLPYIYGESSEFQMEADGLKIPVVAYRGEYDYAHFSMRGEDNGGDSVTVRITAGNPIDQYEISPRKLGIEGEVNGNELTFSMTQDAYLIVRINGGKRLVIGADPMEEDVPDKTGDGIFNILDKPYQAERTGTRISTKAIQKAIDDASAYGTEHGTRGTVYIPVGVYQTASLVMKSNMEIYLEGGAVLRATLDKSQYAVRGHKNSIGKDVIHLIYTENNKLVDPYDPAYDNEENYIESENMRIYGRGTVDVRGRDLEKNAGLLSQSLVPMNCTGFTADGIILRDTSVWSVAPGLSDHLEFTNLKILNTMNHEDDCIDVNGCQDVVVRNVVGVALDDPFSTKTWERGELFQAWCGDPEPNENILFEDCLSWSYCYGFKVGQGSWYDQKNIVFRNGTVYDCAVGLGVHHKYGTAVLSDITFENIDIEHVTYTNDSHRTWLHMEAITGGRDGNLPIQDVTLRNIHVYDKGTSTAKLVGFSNEYGIRGIQMEEIFMEELGKYASTLEELDIKDLYLHCKDLTIDGRPLQDSQEVYIFQLEELKDVAELSENCPNPGTGEGYIYIGSAVGDWASFPIEVKAGSYKLEVMLKKHESKGIFQMYVNDDPLGEPYDQYYNGNKTGVRAEFGTVTFEESGRQNFKFEIVGKNEASKGYALVLDAIRLTSLDPAKKELQRIEITSLPDKTNYYVGELADFTGMVVTAYYADGSSEVLDRQQYTISGFDSKKEGKSTLTVTYKKNKAEFSVEVIKLSQDSEELIGELKDRIASASNAEAIHEVVEDSFGYFEQVEAFTQQIIKLLQDLEKALLHLDKNIKATKVVVDSEIKELLGISPGKVKIDGAALTVASSRGIDELASPSNAVFNIKVSSMEPEIPDSYEEESVACLDFSLDMVTGKAVEEDVALVAPVKITLPFVSGMSANDSIKILHYSDDGSLEESINPWKDDEKLWFIARNFSTFVIVKEKTETENPGEEGGQEPETPTKPDKPEKPSYGTGTRSSYKAVITNTPGEWMKAEHGWWYRLKDGNYPKNDWIIYQGIYYYFDENGYMMTGWVLWKNKWYYLQQTGACLISGVTPDGYLVDSNGAWIQ